MNSLIQAENLKKQLDQLRPLNPETEARIMQKFRLDWNYHSNNLEGNSLTYGETKALILFGITAGGKPFRDSLEIRGHNEAILWVLEVVNQQRPLTESFIRELNKLILKEPYEVNAETPDGKPTKKVIQIGQYKTSPNYVRTRTGDIFYFATPEETPSKMGDLMAWYKDKINDVVFNPILVAAQFHYKFIRIHPFDDGNGRTARILMNFILLANGYPPVVIKTVDKESYLSVLRQADVELFDPFIEFISKNLMDSLNLMLSVANGEDLDEYEDFKKDIQIFGKTLELDNQKEENQTKDYISNYLVIFSNILLHESSSFFSPLFEKTEIEVFNDDYNFSESTAVNYEQFIDIIDEKNNYISISLIFSNPRFTSNLIKDEIKHKLNVPYFEIRKVNEFIVINSRTKHYDPYNISNNNFEDFAKSILKKEIIKFYKELKDKINPKNAR